MLLDNITEQVIAALVAALIIGVVGWLWRRRHEQRRKTETDRQAMYALVRFLENRRALYAGLDAESEEVIIASVRQIRSRLMEDIERLDEESEDTPTLLSMQSACRDYLTVAESMPPLERLRPALQSLRQVFKTEMDKLRYKYGIEPEPSSEDDNPYIGREIGELYKPPTQESRVQTTHARISPIQR
jgi:hypothetical protein